MKPDVLFVADIIFPRFGMERALTDLLETLAGTIDYRVVVLSGERPRLARGRRHVGTASRAGTCTPRHPASAPSAQGRLARPGDGGRGGHLGGASHARGVRRATSPCHGLGALAAPVAASPRVEIRNAARVSYRLLRSQIREVVAVSPPVADEVRRLTRDRKRVITIPNVLADEPVDVPAASRRDSSSPWPTGSIGLLGVGALSSGKNWTLAIQAMEHLPPDYVLAVAGDGPQRPGLEREIRRRGLTDRVILLGFRDDVPQLLSECSVVVHPSYAETFGYSLAEAARAGRPVVCLDLPIMNEVVPDPYVGALARDRSSDFAAAVMEVVRAIGVRGYEPSPIDNREAVGKHWLGVLDA